MTASLPNSDFDHLDPELLRDPAQQYARMRSKCPIAASDRYGGFTTLSRYADVRAGALAHDLLSSAAISIPGEPGMSIPIMVDPPEHARYRSMLGSSMSPRRVRALEPDIRALTTQLIDRFIELGSCDVSRQLTELVPTLLLAQMLGVRPPDAERFTGWIGPLIYHPSDEATTAERASGDLQEFLRALVISRRKDRSDGKVADDIVGRLLEAQIDARPIPTSTIVNMAITLVYGGLGPTTFLMNGALALLDHDRDLRKRLIDEPALRGSVIEEFLRYLSPVQSIGRCVTRDTSLFGHEFAAEDRVLLLWGSANRDETEFEDGDSFDAARAPNGHLAFGAGIHRCLGAHLARAECRIVLDAVLTRIPDYRVSDWSTIQRVTGHMAGITRLPLEFTPGPKMADRRSSEG